MTTKGDWTFRADYLEAQAQRLENEAGDRRQEAARMRVIAAQARNALEQLTATKEG